MGTALILAAAAVVGAGTLWWRWSSRLRAGAGRLEGAWRAVTQALTQRQSALKQFSQVLSDLNLVPVARAQLEEALREVDRCLQAHDPPGLAQADERVSAALRAAYAGLPRKRPPQLRAAQNRLAEAEDGLDLARRHYNRLAVDWNILLGRFPYRWLARRMELRPWDPYVVPGGERELLRRHIPPP
ncbi:MAG: hypothetical protein ACP5G2_02050 [Candidatus Bipolaricaulaceae bacterium]